MQSFKSTEKYFFYQLQIYGVFRETPFYGKKKPCITKEF